MLDIVYYSGVTNNTHRFVEALNWEGNVYRIPILGNKNFTVTTPYVLICPAYGEAHHGHVPPQVRKFLKNEEERNLCVGAIGSGNINFGYEFAAAGKMIANKLGVPFLYGFELAGTTTDREKVKTGLLELGKELDSIHTAKHQ